MSERMIGTGIAGGLAIALAPLHPYLALIFAALFGVGAGVELVQKGWIL